MAKKDSNVIYSTLTSAQEYATWKQNGDLRIKDKSVRINGGANLADNHFITPLGSVTIVTDDELELLQSNPSFKRHVERGFIKVSKGSDKADVEKAVADLLSKDESAPLVPEDFEAEGKTPPASGNGKTPPPPPKA